MYKCAKAGAGACVEDERNFANTLSAMLLSGLELALTLAVDEKPASCPGWVVAEVVVADVDKGPYNLMKRDGSMGDGNEVVDAGT